VIARTRLIDDWLSKAMHDDRDQLVVLGAGLDTRAWRLPALARTIVYEVDHPSTSAAKRRRLAAWSADLRRVRFVEVDFDRDDLVDRLEQAGFDVAQRTIVVWDGVTNYLQPESVDAVMRWVAKLPRGSQIIFTYIDASVLDDPARFKGAGTIMNSLRRSGEPWTFGLHPAGLADYLAERRLRLLDDMGAADYRPRILGAAGRPISGYEFYHVARAEVAGAPTS
jgi:methyltransferase (TIGR00027 family)